MSVCGFFGGEGLIKTKPNKQKWQHQKMKQEKCIFKVMKQILFCL